MVPRGLKGLLKKTARAKFVASRQHGGGYRMLDEKSRKATGARLRGMNCSLEPYKTAHAPLSIQAHGAASTPATAATHTSGRGSP